MKRLAQLMKEVAADAKKRHEQATAAYFSAAQAVSPVRSNFAQKNGSLSRLTLSQEK